MGTERLEKVILKLNQRLIPEIKSLDLRLGKIKLTFSS